MNNTPNSHRAWFQRVCKALDVLIVEGLRESRENAEIWKEWARLRERLAKALFASVALVPMLLVTVGICDIFRAEVRGMPDFIRVVLVEAVIFMVVLCHQAATFTQCVLFKVWLKFNKHI
jgi:hypothetical protein